MTEIKFGGFGGQGVILAGNIIGRAASILDYKHATLTQSIGPEARGGACSAQVIIAEDSIPYPYLTRPNVMVILSQEACKRYLPEAADDAVILIEEDLVQPNPEAVKPGMKIYAIPATRFAEELGVKMTLNIVMVGFFTAVTELISHNAARETVKSSVPAGTETVNLKAFDRGYEYGQSLVSSGKM